MIDPKDPAYRKARRQVARIQGSLRIAAMMTDDDMDDLLMDVLDQMVLDHFDECYEIIKKKKNK